MGIDTPTDTAGLAPAAASAHPPAPDACDPATDTGHTPDTGATMDAVRDDPPPLLDREVYPHIVTRIADLAPWSVLIALRGTCRELRDRVDPYLCRHVVWYASRQGHLLYKRNTNLTVDVSSDRPIPRIIDVNPFHLAVCADDLNLNPAQTFHFLKDIPLVRVLPQPLFLDGDRFFPFQPRGHGCLFGHTVVSFPNVHAAADRMYWTRSERQIVNLLYHPEHTRGDLSNFTGMNQCWVEPHPSPGASCGDAPLGTFLLLTPEGVPPIRYQEGRVGMLTAMLLGLAEATQGSDLFNFTTGGRLVFVGWETWAPEWLDTSFTNWLGQKIVEPTQMEGKAQSGGGDLRARIMWWLDALLSSFPDKLIDLLPVVQFMTVAEFTAEIDDPELLPLILSSYGEPRPASVPKGRGRDGWRDFPYDLVDPPVLWEPAVWETELPRIRGKSASGCADAALHKGQPKADQKDEQPWSGFDPARNRYAALPGEIQYAGRPPLPEDPTEGTTAKEIPDWTTMTMMEGVGLFGGPSHGRFFRRFDDGEST